MDESIENTGIRILSIEGKIIAENVSAKDQILDLSSSVDRNTTVTYSRIPYLNNCSPKSFVIIAQQLRVVPS